MAKRKRITKEEIVEELNDSRIALHGVALASTIIGCHHLYFPAIMWAATFAYEYAIRNMEYNEKCRRITRIAYNISKNLHALRMKNTKLRTEKLVDKYAGKTEAIRDRNFRLAEWREAHRAEKLHDVMEENGIPIDKKYPSDELYPYEFTNFKRNSLTEEQRKREAAILAAHRINAGVKFVKTDNGYRRDTSDRYIGGTSFENRGRHL